MVSKYILMAIIFSGLVTWIPRMIPFILAKYKGLPAIVERFLQIKWLDFLAVFPTAFVAFRYRNLVGTVLFGVVLIAALRFIF